MTTMLILIFWISIFIVAYTYLGYPLLLSVFAHLRPPRRFAETELPYVTLLIAAFNEEEIIEAKLEDALSYDYPKDRLQILIAADGSSDATPQLVEKFQDRGVELCFHPPRQGKLAAIVNAFQQARGDIVVLTDANNMFSKDAIRHLVQPYADPRVGAVGGAKRILQDGQGLSASEGLYWKYESFIKRQESRLGTCISMPGEILSLRRELFEPPKQAVIVDDIYMSLLVLIKGYNIAYQPQAESFEPVSASAKDEFERRARSVAGRYQAVLMIPLGFWLRRPLVMWQYLSHKIFRMLLPFAMVGALASNALLLVFPFPLGSWGMSRSAAIAFLLSQLLFYGMALVGSLVKLPGILGRIFYLPAFLVSSNLAGIAGFYRHIMRRQAATWQRVARQRVELK